MTEVLFQVQILLSEWKSISSKLSQIKFIILKSRIFFVKKRSPKYGFRSDFGHFYAFPVLLGPFSTRIRVNRSKIHMQQVDCKVFHHSAVNGTFKCTKIRQSPGFWWLVVFSYHFNPMELIDSLSGDSVYVLKTNRVVWQLIWNFLRRPEVCQRFSDS